MSNETSVWLNTNVLVGMTDQRGKAWHYNQAAQGAESNHYAGPIPVEDVNRRLFDFEVLPRRVAVEVPASFDTMTHISDSGEPMMWAIQGDRQAMAASDTHEVFGMFKDQYAGHGYSKWLMSDVEGILGSDLVISSAGLLANRAIAWVESSLPETVETSGGVAFRPNILSTTSFNGKLATTWKLTVTMVVCDNTLRAAQSESGPQFKIKHSKNSAMRIGEARDALGLIVDEGAAFAAEIERLTSQKVSDAQFIQMLDVIVPTAGARGVDLSKAALTKATAKRDRLFSMWRTDERVAPWTNTGLGVVQAFNTWEHHDKPTRGATNRAERNMMAALDGSTDESDGRILELLAAL